MRERDWTDVEVFADRALGLRLWPHQVEAARSEAFITTVAAARRTGKSTLAEVLACWTAFVKPGSVTLVISATEDSAKRLLESIAARLNSRSLTRGAVVDDTKHRIDLGNGSRIVSVPASARQVRGYGRGVHLVIVDEGGFVAPEVWTAAHYTALDERGNGSRILLCGTPWGGAEHFFRRAFEAGLAGDPDHASHRWTYKANPKLDAAYLERQRDRVSPVEYAAEVLGEWSTALGSLFPMELLESAVADIDLTPLSTLHGPAAVTAGVDWGRSYDRSALVAVARCAGVQRAEDDPRPVFAVVCIEHWPLGTPTTVTVRDIVASPARWWALCAEDNGLGISACDQLGEAMGRRIREVGGDVLGRGFFLRTPMTSESKVIAYGGILEMLQEGSLVLPRHPDLLRQLAGLRTEQHERGVRIEAESPAVHDDLADALALASTPFRPEGGRWSSRLAHAARRSDLPGFALPERRVDFVTTPRGVAVPRTPYRISILGDEVTEMRPVRPEVTAAQAKDAEMLHSARAAVAAVLNRKGTP